MARKSKTESPPTDEPTDSPASTETPPASPALPDPARHTALVKRLENDFKYHAPKEGQPGKYEAIRAAGHTFAMLLVASCPDGRELSSALSKIDEAVFWGNAAIARNS